jgi:hypothetical protein
MMMRRMLPPIKRKVFVSYHHRGDQAYYDAFCRAFCDEYEVVYDNSLERRIDSDNIDYVRGRIKDNYINGSSCTLVLVGKDTWGRKYIDWEIDATLEMKHGLIGVRLPTAPLGEAGKTIVPSRLHHNVASGYAIWVTWENLTPAHLTGSIEQANLRPKSLIDNSCERRYRNAPL